MCPATRAGRHGCLDGRKGQGGEVGKRTYAYVKCAGEICRGIGKRDVDALRKYGRFS